MDKIDSCFRYFLRNVYGQYKAYPANWLAQEVAELMGVKTFNAQQLAKIRGLGFNVVEVPDHKAEL